MVNTIGNHPKGHLPAAPPAAKESLATRIVNIALPALELYHPISPYLSIVSTAYQFSCVILKTGNDIINFDAAALGQDGKDIIKITSMIALAILFPKIQSVGLNIYEIGINLNQFTNNLASNNYNAAVQNLMCVVQGLAGIGIELYAAPEIIAISLIAHALKEILQASKEFNNGRYLEGMANLIFAIIRVQRATPHIQTAFAEFQKTEMNQEDLTVLIAEIKENKKHDEIIDFKNLLNKLKSYAKEATNFSDELALTAFYDTDRRTFVKGGAIEEAALSAIARELRHAYIQRLL